MLKKAQAEVQPEKNNCVDCHALNGLLLPVLMDHSRAQSVLSLVFLPEIDKLYAMQKVSIVYSLLDYTSRYHHIPLSHEAQKKSFVTLIDKFKFKNVLFGLGLSPIHFQQLIN